MKLAEVSGLFLNGVTMLHDCCWGFENDISAYCGKKFYELLKLLDTKHRVAVKDEERLDFTSGNELTYSNLPDELYTKINTELNALPVFTELRRMSQIIDSAYGAPAQMEVSPLSEEDKHILLRILGLTNETIETILDTSEAVSLAHRPGFLITMLENGRITVDYNPEPVALEAVEKTLLWSKAGEEIMCGLGKNHLSSTLLEIISEGGVRRGDRRRFESRYGNGYADITRLLSSCIGKEQYDTYHEIWGDSDYELTHEDEKKWLTLSTEATNEPARLFFRLMYDVCFAQYKPRQANEATAEHPQFNLSNIIHYKDGSCKDAETYYCGSSREKLIQQGPYFLEKK